MAAGRARRPVELLLPSRSAGGAACRPAYPHPASRDGHHAGCCAPSGRRGAHRRRCRAVLPSPWPPPNTYAARRLTLLSAMSVSFLSAAFSSWRFCSSRFAPSLQVGAIVAAEPLRPGDQRAVARDLVMLDRLRGGD